MTCIVGIETADAVYLGSDSANCNTYRTHVRATPKVIERNGHLFGSCGTSRLSQLIEHVLTVPPIPDTEPVNAHQWMVASVVPLLRTCLKDNGLLHTENNVDTIEGGSHFLVAVAGKLFDVQADLSVQAYAEDYMAAGSGYEYALGALHATPTVKPVKRIRRALEAASYHNPFCRPPFHVAASTYDAATRRAEVTWHTND